MNAVCHTCHLERTGSDSGRYCRSCGQAFCKNCAKKVKADEEVYVGLLCNVCYGKYAKESPAPSQVPDSSAYTPLIYPLVPSTNANPGMSTYGGENAEACLCTCRDELQPVVIEHSAECSCGSSLKDIDIHVNNNAVDSLSSSSSMEESSASSSITVNNHQDNSGDREDSSKGVTLDVLNKEIHGNDSEVMHNIQDSDSDKLVPRGSPTEDVGHTQSLESSNSRTNSVETTSQAFVLKIETDHNLWLPPEPEDMEDDIELSVANNDEDDEYTDGTKWAQPSSFGSFDGENGVSHSYKDDRKKAMLEAMNGQFKFLVSRFLASEGISNSNAESRYSWLDVVASLSWQAALLIKPDASEGRAMDPASYVKVKCIACGSRGQSEVIKGLVFKKNTAHKHMPTKFKNPRLLLLRGVLGERAAGLSSFSSMEQEKDNLKSVIEMIDTCHPNVVLVEKTVSRDVQESLLAKGITLVFDMKLPRLEKIARCTGSRIISSDGITSNIELKKCDSFHVEKFVEEHNISGDSGKKPSKTLMFFDGCPKPLGCTILLKGAPSDELKKVKRVMQYTVFAAYHLILETSFFADQRAICFDSNNIEKQIVFKDKPLPSTNYNIFPHKNLIMERSSADMVPEYNVDIPLSNGLPENSGIGESQQISYLDTNEIPTNSVSLEFSSHYDTTSQGSGLMRSNTHYDSVSNSDTLGESHDSPEISLLPPGQCLSSIPSSFKQVLTERFLHDFSGSSASVDSDFNFIIKERDNHNIVRSGDSQSLGTSNFGREEIGKIDEEVTPTGAADGVQNDSVSDLNESLEHVADASKTINMLCEDDIAAMLDTQSILILYSSRCVSKETICEQNQLSRIKYYGNFDMSLGRFLQDILLNQRHSCAECGESPEAHIYCYTHQNGKLTVQVKRLPPQSHLSGEAEGKIWMWTRCLKCQHEGGSPRPTRRVVMSTAARGLSFGKFLELSFSSHSAARRLSRCGHLLHRDCLRFFGFGSKVAMFRYSPVEIYAACKPPPVLEFNSPIRHEWIEKAAKDVVQKGKQFFSEVESLLQNMRPNFSKQCLNYLGSVREFSEVEEMLRQEKLEFEASILIATNGYLDQSAPGVNLTYLYQDLLLGLYVWERRIHFLQSHKQDSNNCGGSIGDKKMPESHNPMNESDEGNNIQNGCKEDITSQTIPIDIEETSTGDFLLSRNVSNASSTGHVYLTGNFSNVNKEQEMYSGGSLGDTNSEESQFLKRDAKVADSQEAGLSLSYITNKPSDLSVANGEYDLSSENRNIKDNGLFPLQVDIDAPFTSAYLQHSMSDTLLDVKIEDMSSSGEVPGRSTEIEDFLNLHDSSSLVKSKASGQDWIWIPFPEMHKVFLKDHPVDYSKKFESFRSYTFQYLAAVHQLIARETELLSFPVGTEGTVVSVHDEEVSSIIACALTLLGDEYNSVGGLIEKEMGKDKDTDKAIENAQNLASEGSVASSYWSSIGSFNLERIQSSQSLASLSSDEHSSGAEGSSSLQPPEGLHPKISIGTEKTTGKSKYSVICIYGKQFYALRKRCCPSELAYITSLSHCKKWDAQGGKSKAIFAKTLDDRFIIKEIKKTELDSFLKFAPEYFKHITGSLKSGSQTCLAKILGIYQVKQIKNGKETKADLMVMENLLYGRNVTRTYDLKGAVYDRYISDPDNRDRVLLDQNFVEDMGLSPMYIGGRTKHLLQRAIWNDTSFLTSINVMDYSLLVGVDKQRHELIFGIIDYLRQYTWDKQLETWVKSSLVVPKNSLPTVISPREYKKRFRKFMSKYFWTVPDGWTPDTCSCADTCKLCSNGNSNSSRSHCAASQRDQEEMSTKLLVAKA